MKILRNNIELLDIGFIPDKSVHRQELMAENCITLDFELADYLKLEKGDKVVYDNTDFFLNKDYIPAINKATDGYKYDLTFYDTTERFKDFKLKYLLRGVDELDFKLTTSGDKFLDVVIYSLQKHGLGTFTKGLFPTEIKEIHFQNVDIFSGLNLIAETYKLEWWKDGNVFNLGKLEFGTPVLLEYDKALGDISFSNSSEKLITRLYAFGSNRNLPLNYRTNSGAVDNIAERRLRLPQGTDYVDLFPNLPEKQIIEGVQVFDHVYPRQKNKIIEVAEEERGEDTETTQKTTIFTIKGDNAFTLTKEQLLPGQPLKIAFQTGKLAGREFELIIDKERPNYFEIKYTQEGNVYLPNPTLKPEAGNEFFFFNFKADAVLPTLIPLAENELKAEAENFLDKLGSEFVYDAKTRSIFCENNNIDLQIGQKVTIQSPTLGSITSRIRRFEKNIYNKFECDYQVGDSAQYSRLAEMGKAVEAANTAVNNGSLFQNVSELFLSKKYSDTAAETITFAKGIISADTSRFTDLIASGRITAKDVDVSDTLKTEILKVLVQAEIKNLLLKGQINSETFTSGFLGDGFRLNNNNGRWTLELDDLIVRKTMQIYELIVQKIRYQGGQVLHSPAGGKITDVTDGGSYWRCEHDGTDDFITDSQVLCQTFKVGSKKDNPDGSATFHGARVKRYWRKVTSYGAGWFNLSKTDMETGSDAPETGDDVAVLGHRTNADWQNAILLVSTGAGAPYMAYYAGINSYSLAGKEAVREGNLSGIVDNVFGQLSGFGLYANNVYLRGIIRGASGKTAEELFEEQHVGGKNLLREYDIRFNFKYWGGTGEFLDIDIDNIIELLSAENGNLIITENNILIDFS